MQLAARLRVLPPLSAGESDRLIAQQRAQGVDVISLASTSPDLPPPPRVVDALVRDGKGQTAYRHSSYLGQPALRASIARWYNTRFKHSLNPKNEVLPINGTKEGLGFVPWIVCNPGDVVLVPDPSYRLYEQAAGLAGAAVVSVPLLSEEDFLPDLRAIPPATAAHARLLYINYPNNPTGAVAPARFYHDVVAFAKQYDVVVCQDMAFSEIAYDGFRPLSFLEIPGAMDVGIEFHSCSMTYNMLGYRVAMAVGNPRLIEALTGLKGVVGASLSDVIQHAAIAALDTTPDWLQQRNQIYQRRRDRLVPALERVGLRARKPKAAPFIWAAVPGGRTSLEFATQLLQGRGVWVQPGSAFGSRGEGYVRASLMVPDDRLDEAVRRLERADDPAPDGAGDPPAERQAPDEQEEDEHGSLGA